MHCAILKRHISETERLRLKGRQKFEIAIKKISENHGNHSETPKMQKKKMATKFFKLSYLENGASWAKKELNLDPGRSKLGFYIWK